MEKPASVRSGFFQWKSHELYYEVWGDGGTPFLLMHGLLCDVQLNRALARRLVAEGHRVVLMDFLGHGRSAKPTDPREYRVDFCAQQGLACLDHLGIDKAVIGGVSLGAIATLFIAHEQPDRCLGMFLEMPVMEWSTIFAGTIILPISTLVAYFPRAYKTLTWPLKQIRTRNEIAAALISGLTLEPAVINALLHGLMVGPVVPSSEQRRQLQQPAIVIGHAKDRLHQYRDALALSRELPNAHFVKAGFGGVEIRSERNRLWPEVQGFLARIHQPGSKRSQRAAADKH